MNRTPRLLAGLVVGSLVIAACSGGDDDDAAPTTELTTTTVAAMMLLEEGKFKYKGTFGGKSKYQISIDTSKRKLSFKASKINVSGLTSSSIISLAYGSFVRVNALDLEVKSSGSSESYIY